MGGCCSAVRFFTASPDDATAAKTFIARSIRINVVLCLVYSTLIAVTYLAPASTGGALPPPRSSLSMAIMYGLVALFALDGITALWARSSGQSLALGCCVLSNSLTVALYVCREVLAMIDILDETWPSKGLEEKQLAIAAAILVIIVLMKGIVAVGISLVWLRVQRGVLVSLPLAFFEHERAHLTDDLCA